MFDTEEKQQSITRLFDFQPDSVVWFVPLFEAERVTDFRVEYCNLAACELLKSDRSAILGIRLLESVLMDESSKRLVFDQCLEVWNNGKAIEYNYFNPGLNKYFNVQRSRVQDGVLSITRDQTELYKVREEKERQSQLVTDLVENSPYGISLYESIRDDKNEIIDFRLKLCNKKSAEITGFSVEDLYRYTVKELMQIRGQSGYFDMCAGVVKTGKPVYTEFYRQASAHWLAFSLVKFEDGYLLNYIDITQTKEFEIKATRQSETLKSILDASITGLLCMDPFRDAEGKVIDFTITMINAAGQRILGLDSSAIGQRYLQLFPTAYSAGLFDLHVKVLNTGEHVQKDFHYAGEGLDGWYITSIAKMGDNSVVQSFLDITDKVHDKLSLENTVKKLEASNRDLEEMTYAASHDLQEPLRKISTYTMMAIEELKDSPAQIYLDKVVKSSGRMSELVKSILNFSKLSDQQKFVQADLEKILENVLSDLEIRIKEKNAHISFKGLTTITGIPSQLGQLFSNLIGNSLKFSGTEPLIRIECKEVELQHLPTQIIDRERSYVELKFSDNGIGFKQEFSEKIFTMFRRLHAAQEYSGTGIGLAVCRKIVENHNGYIMAQSREKEGATFFVYLPR